MMPWRASCPWVVVVVVYTLVLFTRLTQPAAANADSYLQQLNSQECYNIPGGVYGNVHDGAAAYAPLVGVTCTGKCHEEAQAWGGAVGPKTNIFHPGQCAEICANTSDCEVWTWRKDEKSCEYRKARTNLSPMWVQDHSYDAFSGPVNCSQRWLPTFETLQQISPDDPVSSCPTQDRIYGDLSSGSCSDSKVVEVFGSEKVLALGIEQQWWPRNATSDSEFIVYNVDSCRDICNSMSDVCGGYTFTYLQDNSTVCLLKEEPSCTPVFGTKTNTFAGTSGSCLLTAEGEEGEIDPFFTQCETPRCKEPHDKGTFIDDVVFKPSDHNCFYHIADRREMLECMEGSWYLVSGGSNAILTYLNWVNSIKPGLLHTQRDDIRTFYSDMVDVVFDTEGNVLFLQHLTWQEMGTYSEFKGEIDFTRRRGIVTEWNKAPHRYVTTNGGGKEATVQGLVRLTLVIGQYWQNSRVSWELMNNVNTPWKDAPKALYAQVGIWYAVCGIWNIYFCNNPSLRNIGRSATLQAFRNDFDEFLTSVRDSCANSLGCIVAPHVYDEGITSEVFTMKEYMKTQVNLRGTKKLFVMDTFSLTSLKPDENVESHVTPFLALWVVHILMNTFCTYSKRDVGCPPRVTFSNGCLAGTLDRKQCSDCDCPLYRQLCINNSDGCKDWECMNSRTCTVSTTTLAISTDAAIRNVSSANCEPVLEVHLYHPHNTTFSDTGGKRLWDGKDWEGWLLSLSTWAASIIMCFSILLSNKRKGKPDENYQQKPDGKPHYLGALGFARFIASIHIVVGHLYAKGALQDSIYLFKYGFTWVPWFFMLSGFVLTHARLTSRDPSKVDGPLHFLWKRTANIFPMYSFGVLIAGILIIVKGKELPKYWILILQSWLLQSFLPTATERALQVHCWFLSCMVIYWLSFKTLYTLIREFKIFHTLAFLLLLAIIPWIGTAILPTMIGEPLEWYREHQFGDVGESVDIWTVFVKFHPLCYGHVFFFGMVLSKLRYDLLEVHRNYLSENIKWLWTCLQYGCAALGYTGLLLVFNIEEMQPMAYKLSSRLSILMPLQGLVLLGLSMQEDPVATCFKKVPKIIGDSSYSQYVLQFIAYELWPTRKIGDVSFFIFLASAAVISVKAIQENARKLWMTTKLSLLVAPSVLTIVLVCMSEFYEPEEVYALPAMPRYVNVSTGGYAAADIRLDFKVPADLERFSVINPSLVLDKDSLLLAARFHAVSTSKNRNVPWQHTRVTEVITKWESAIAVGQLSKNAVSFFEQKVEDLVFEFELEKLRLVSNASSPNSSFWGSDQVLLCESKPVYIPSNNTLMRKVVTSAEDPKLLALSSSRLALSFNSLPPPNLAKNGPDCHQNGNGVQQMFLSYTKVGHDLQKDTTHGVRIKCGHSTRDEKNWIAFEYGEQIFYVYSVYPHKILQVRPEDGACAEKWSTSYNPLLDAKVKAGPGVEIHGSGTATYVKDEQTQEEYYVSLLHFLKKEGQVYTTMAYRFEAKPPFRILSVSRPLSLQDSTKAFASGLLLLRDQNKVLVSYGVRDTESRVLAMEWKQFNALFSCL